MSEFTERVRRETQERITALDAAIEELKAERLQLNAIITSIDAYEPKIERRESEDRSEAGIVTPDMLTRACGYVDQGRVFTLTQMVEAIGEDVFTTEKIVEALVAEGVVVNVSLAFDPPDPRRWVKVGEDEGAEQAARAAADEHDLGPGPFEAESGEDDKSELELRDQEETPPQPKSDSGSEEEPE